MLIEEFFPGVTNGYRAETRRSADSPMNCDILEYEDRFEIEVELPGFAKENIKVELQDGYLTVQAERHSEHAKDEKVRVIRSERFTGKCQRTFDVSDKLMKEDIKAAFENGILRLTIPKNVSHPEEEAKHTISIE